MTKKQDRRIIYEILNFGEEEHDETDIEKVIELYRFPGGFFFCGNHPYFKRCPFGSAYFVGEHSQHFGPRINCDYSFGDYY